MVLWAVGLLSCIASTEERASDVGEIESALGPSWIPGREPDNLPAQATLLSAGGLVVRGTISPNADVDFYAFEAAAGDRLYAATMTRASASNNTNSVLAILASDGTTVIEEDNDDGSFSGLASSIAGAVLPAAGTYYLLVRNNSVTSQIRPYDLYFRRQSGSPVAEVEPNDLPESAQPLPASGWVDGSLLSVTDVDLYAVTLNAGDTVFASLDLEPGRTGEEWNGALSIGSFDGQVLTANDGGNAGPDSEALFTTVKSAGTYYLGVSAPGTTYGAYDLSVTVLPTDDERCTTYTSTDIPKTIPTKVGQVTSTLTIPGHPRIERIEVGLNLTHANMQDVDVHLRSPAGNDNGLFSDVGAGAATMDLVLAQNAAIPIGPFPAALSGLVYQPEPEFRLGWFEGEDAGGVWTLVVEDDTNANGGTLDGWRLTVCEPAPISASGSECGFNTYPVTVFSTDFESDAAGFTHSGVQDEWELGTPSAGVFTTCNSGTSCFKTDLDGTYDIGSSQDLLSPLFELAGLVGPIRVSWAQEYQLETANFDHASVDVQPAGGGAGQRLFEFVDYSLFNSTFGLIGTTLQESAGWGVRTAEVSSFAGQSVQLRFHLDSDDTVVSGGFAIDDVSVTACRTNVCGDGVVAGTETCEDNNTVDGDGCDSNCTVTACGNGVVTAPELCDDGNAVNGDGCDSNCTVTACGNGVLTPPEECDDGNTADGDACSSGCLIEGGGGSGGGGGGGGGGGSGGGGGGGGGGGSGGGGGGGGCVDGCIGGSSSSGGNVTTGDDVGCGCEMPGKAPHGSSWDSAAAAVVAVAWLRRQRRSASL